MRRIAIIDMGTNIFNLLVADVDEHGVSHMVSNSKYPVKLGEGGLNGHIVPSAHLRGIEAFSSFFETINQFGCSEVHAFATSAVRDATNGLQFVREVATRFNIDIQIISGEREAELIYLGVRQAIELGQSKALIIDIGGGSIELIIADGSQLFWRQSFNLGVTRLMQLFNPSDPITPAQVTQIEGYLISQMPHLDFLMREHRPQRVVGSSGSFDTYRSILTESGAIQANGQPQAQIPLGAYLELHRQLLTMSIEQRKQIRGMELVRVEMIGLASIITHLLVSRFDITRMYQSLYALKEGALWQLMNPHKWQGIKN